MDKFIDKQNEIITLLNNMRLKHLNVQVQDNKKKQVVNGFITKVDLNGVSVYFDSIPELIPTKNLVLLFEYSKNFYYSDNLDLRLLNIQLKNVELTLPNKLYFHPVRRFTRVDVPEGLIKITIKKIESSSKEQSKTVNIDELPATLRNIYMELNVDQPDIKKIVSMIGDELSRFSSKYRINIFKDLSNLSPLEKVVNFYKKTFWVEDTENLNTYIHVRDKYGVIGYEKYFEFVKKTMSPEIMDRIKQNYINNNIISYVMVPILLGDRVAGIIEVTVPGDLDSKNEQIYKKLSIYEIFYIKGLADILGEVIVKTKSSVNASDSQLTVVDISMGGILAFTKNIYLTHELRENTIVVLSLNFENEELELTSRVVRYNYIPGENAGLNIAFDFIVKNQETEAKLGSIIRKILKISLEKK